MTKWKLKSCPRCGGDMLIDKDLDFWYEQCLQCSYRIELQPLNSYNEPVPAGECNPEGDSDREERN